MTLTPVEIRHVKPSKAFIGGYDREAIDHLLDEIVASFEDVWRGRANDAVVRLLADTLALPRTSVTLVSGHSARDKIVELAGVDPEQIERRLSSAAGKERRA